MRLTSTLFASLSVAVLFAVPSAARADGIDDFTITYYNYNYVGDTEVYTFSLPANAVPGCVDCVEKKGSFTFDNVAFNVQGDESDLNGPGTDTETFFSVRNQDYNTSTDFYDYSFDNSYGGLVAFPAHQQYFSGSVSDPTFIPGTYSFTYGDGEATADGTLVIAAETPEPSSLVLLGTGLIGLVGAARRRFKNPRC